MDNNKPLAEILESLRAIFAGDLDGKSIPRRKATADPALWRALNNQRKSSGDLFLRAVTTKGDGGD